MVVDKQVSFTFIVGKYSDEILCYVIPMEATHILIEGKEQREKEKDKRELKVAQNLDCINYEDLTNVKLIILSFEEYVLI
ncbi:hypothetical protein CR513_42267, partial [Mucuna pruriens]